MSEADMSEVDMSEVDTPMFRFGKQRLPFKLQVGDLRLRGEVLQVWCRKPTVNGKLSRTRGRQDCHWVTLGVEESQDQLNKYEEKQK